MYVLYNIILFIAAVVGVPYYLLKMIFTGKYRKSLFPKLGYGQAQLLAKLKSAPRVWVHAVSVGEVTVAVGKTDIIYLISNNYLAIRPELGSLIIHPELVCAGRYPENNLSIRTCFSRYT